MLRFLLASNSNFYDTKAHPPAPHIVFMSYYYADTNNQTIGPVSEAELHNLYRTGTISLDTAVIPEGQSEWREYRSLTVPKSALRIFATAPSQVVTRLEPAMVSPAAVMKECPFCAEPISVAAKKCKHCGETLDVALRAAEEAKRAGSNHPMVFMNAGGGVAVEPQRKSFPHVIHLVLTLFTAGIWLPIWVLHYLFRSRAKYG